MVDENAFVKNANNFSDRNAKIFVEKFRSVPEKS